MSIALLDEEALHLLPLGAGLVRDELHAVDGARLFLGVLERLGDLDAAALAASAGVDLRLDDDDGLARLLLHPGNRGVGFVDAERGLADGDGNTVALQQLLALILVNLQGFSSARKLVTRDRRAHKGRIAP